MLITLFDLIVVVMGLGPKVEKLQAGGAIGGDGRMPVQWLGKYFMARGCAHGWADGRGRRLARSGIIHADSCGAKLSARFVARMTAQGSLYFSGTA